MRRPGDPGLRTGAFTTARAGYRSTGLPGDTTTPMRRRSDNPARTRFAIVENRIRTASVLSSDTEKRRMISC